jgi:hypothetical protein
MSSEKRASAPHLLCRRFVHTKHNVINFSLGKPQSLTHESTPHPSRRMRHADGDPIDSATWGIVNP